MARKHARERRPERPSTVRSVTCTGKRLASGARTSCGMPARSPLGLRPAPPRLPPRRGRGSWGLSPIVFGEKAGRPSRRKRFRKEGDGANQIHPLHNGTTTSLTRGPPLHSDIADNAAMPWKATDEMKERMNFVLEWDRRWNDAQGGPVDMAELCRKYGVSRPTGYAWVKRFRDANHDVRAVAEKSRRPQTNPHAISAQVEDLVVQARKLMPRRGPRKLRRLLVEQYAEIEWPSTSSIGNILKRRG